MRKFFFAIFLLILFNCKKNTVDNSSPTAITTTSTNVNTSSTVCKGLKTDIEKIQIFPVDHPLNKDISTEAVDPNSAIIINNIGTNTSLKADFGSGLWENAPIGIPFDVVCNSQTKSTIIYRQNSRDDNYGNESDKIPMPIPSDATIEGNGQGDSHILVVDKDNLILYELYNASKGKNGWEASAGAVFDLKKTEFRPEGWTSADAAGLPIMPLLVRYDEVAAGIIKHAIRFTLQTNKIFGGYIFPARHKVQNGSQSNQSPMGMRLRLKANVAISNYSKTNQVILTAMKKYGLILADGGGDMYISGTPDERWNNDDLHELGRIKTTDFEVIKMGDIKR